MEKKNTNGLKPHYAPLIKPYKKGVEVYPHTDYRKTEVYPHTEYHKQEPFWLYREMGILKQWLMSLTKLYNKLAITETEDTIETTQELKNIIDKFQDLLNCLESKLNELYECESVFKNNVASIMQNLNLLASEVNNIISSLNPLFNNLFDCIENRLIKHDSYITDIFKNIEEIYNILTDVLTESSNTTWLSQSSYEVEFFNYFKMSKDVKPAIVREESVMNTPSAKYITRTYYFVSNNDYPISNSFIYDSTTLYDSDCPLFRHSKTVEDCPRSKIAEFTLPEWEGYSYITSGQSDSFGTRIWNMLPKSARASFTANVTAYKVNDTRFGMSAVNYADGINGQFYDYILLGISDTISFNYNLNICPYIILTKTEI